MHKYVEQLIKIATDLEKLIGAIQADAEMKSSQRVIKLVKNRTKDECSVLKGEQMKLDNKTISRRHDGRWWARYYNDGKVVCIYGKTQKEVYQKLKQALADKKMGRVNKKNYNVHEWINFWYDLYKKPNLKSKTMEINIRLHILPNLPNIPIEQLNGQDVVRMCNNLKTDNLKNACFKTLKECFTQAVADNVLKTSPMTSLKTPKYERKQGEALTLEEEKQFIEMVCTLDNHTLRDIFIFMLYTGVRRSEALSLTRCDIDWSAKTIHIRGTKTAKSDRVIPLFESVREILERLDETWASLHPDTLSKTFKKLCPRHKLHDLRHTFATRCLENDIPMKIVQHWLGHSDYQTTANIYTGITTNFEAECVAKIDTHFDTHFLIKKQNDTKK